MFPSAILLQNKYYTNQSRYRCCYHIVQFVYVQDQQRGCTRESFFIFLFNNIILRVLRFVCVCATLFEHTHTHAEANRPFAAQF